MNFTKKLIDKDKLLAKQKLIYDEHERPHNVVLVEDIKNMTVDAIMNLDVAMGVDAT